MDVTRKLRAPGYMLLMPAVYFLLHMSYGLGSIAGVLRAASVSWRRKHMAVKEGSCMPQH